MTRKASKKCVFCGGSNLSKTHIWPNWLNKLITPTGNATYSTMSEHEEFTYLYAEERKAERQTKSKQGSLFTRKPYLACVKCNTGWMEAFEKEMLKFAEPLFTGDKSITLNAIQMQTFAGWMTLIEILSEYMNAPAGNVSVTEEERDCFRRSGKPPANWSIFAATLNAEIWRVRYNANPRFISAHVSEYESRGEVPYGKVAPNARIASFGMGNLFIHVFHNPSSIVTSDFRAAARSYGLIPIWPIPSFWPFTKGKAHFPTKLVVDDERAEMISTAFGDRLDAVHKMQRKFPDSWW